MIIDNELVGKYVRVRSISIDDAEIALKMRMDTEKTRYMGQVENNLEHEIKWISEIRDKPNDYFFMVTDIEGKPIGNAGIYDIEGNEAQIGRILMYGNALQSIETYLLIIDFAFNSQSIDSLWGVTDPNNKSALKHAKLFGFVFSEPLYYEKMDRIMCIGRLNKCNYATYEEKVKKMIYR